MMTKLLFVALGGGLGSMLRFLTSFYIAKYYSGAFPLFTFAVNILGCLLVGVLFGFSGRFLSENVRLLVIPGFCGGYTTFSAFALENLNLVQEGHYFVLITYILLSVVVGILAVWAGYQLSCMIK